MPGLDTLIAAVGAATSIISVSVAVAAFRRSGPRVRISTGDFSFTRSIRDRFHRTGQLQISFHIANTGDTPVTISGMTMLGLAPRPRGSSPELIVIESGVVLKSVRKIVATRHTRYRPLGRFGPVRVPRRRSARWQEYTEPLELPPAADLTISPFDGRSVTAPATWSIAKETQWLRLEVRLTTGTTLQSSWWRNPQDIIELYEEEATSLPAAIRAARAFRVRTRLPGKKPSGSAG
jgi:hypothetical protein